MSDEKLAQLDEDDGHRMPVVAAQDRETIEWAARQLLAAGEKYRPSHIVTAEQAMLTMLAGWEFRLGPIASINQIYVVNGRPTMMATAQLALVARSGLGYFEWGECSATSATITGYRYRPGGGEPKGQDFTYTMAEATNAGLLKNAVWKAFPADMLRHKVATRLCRFLFPDVVMGLWSPDEMGARMTRDELSGELAVDVQALIDGDLEEPATEQERQRAVTDAEFEEEGGADFDQAGAGDAQGLDVTPQGPDPMAVAREEIAEVVGELVQEMVPPEEPPMWAMIAEDPLTKLACAELMFKLGLSKPSAGALYAFAVAQGAGDHTAVWNQVRNWWYDGRLAARLYEALLAEAEVPITDNPFEEGEQA